MSAFSRAASEIKLIIKSSGTKAVWSRWSMSVVRLMAAQGAITVAKSMIRELVDRAAEIKETRTFGTPW